MDDLADSFDVAVAISTFSTTSIVVFIEAIAIERERFILEYEMCNLYVTQWAILECNSFGNLQSKDVIDNSLANAHTNTHTHVHAETLLMITCDWI